MVMLVGSMSAKAQFPTTDSLKAFINRWIRNSAVEAFQNLRLNTALIGTANFIDSSYGGQVRSFSALNDSTARLITIGNDTFDVVIRGIPADSTIFATVYSVDSAKVNLRTSIATKLNISDTTNKWINDIRRRAGTDTVEKFKNGSWQFAYIDSSGGGSGISGLTAGRVTLSTSATTVGDDAGLTYNSTSNELTTDSTSAIQHRADYVTLNAVQEIDTIRSVGNSITVGLNASPQTDSGYIYRFGDALGKPVGNYAASGTGAVTAIARHFQYTPLPNNDMSTVMAGFNDIRRNNITGATGFKTKNKIINAHKSIFVNHFMKSYVQAGCTSCGVTRYGSWTANWNATAEAGKSTNGAFTSTLNDSIVYTFTDSTVCVGLIGQTSGFQAGSAFSVYIDNVLVQTGTTHDQTDGVGDGFSNNNNRAPMAVIVTGLTNAAHTVKVVNNGSGVFIVDYFSHLRSASTSPPLMIFHAPYMNATGYATSPANSSNARTDTLNSKIDSLVASFPSAYQSYVYKVETNNCYDTLTGTDSDGIHPNNTGHRQIYECAIAALNANTKPLGSMYYANDAAYFVTTNGSEKILFGSGANNYVAKIANGRVTSSIIQDDGTNIGIGQTPATYKLSVTGTLRSTADAYFATSSGNVGVGTTSPGFKLDVNGHIGSTGSLFTKGASSGVSIDSRQSSTGAWSLYADNAALKFYSIANTLDRIKFWARGGMTIGYAAESVIADLGSTLDVHGSVRITPDSVAQVSSVTSERIALLDTITGKIKRIPASALGGNGIYGGNGSLPSDVTVTGGNNSLIVDDIFAFRINSDYNVIAKANGSGTYTEAILGTGNEYWLGYTPTVSVYSKGAAIVIDTNNSVGIGTNAPTAILHLKAGTATANTAPLKFTSGTNLTTPEAGAVEYDGTNYFVTNGTARYKLSRTLTGSTTWDPASIGANSSTTTTLTVTGAALGDPVTISKTSGSYSNGEIYFAYVSATDTVTIQLQNGSGGTFDIASAAFNVIVLKY